MLKLLKLLIEIFSWIKIVLSPALLGLIVAAVIYFSLNNSVGQILAIIIALGGLVTGIVWATRVWKKQGTTNFLARLSSSPDFDKLSGKP